MLDHQVRSVCLVQHCLKLAGRLIHTHGCIPDAADIALLLPGVDVRFRKNNFVTEPLQIFINSAIVRGGAVPVRRSDAGSKNKNLHLPSSSSISSNCSARFAHACAASTVCSPL